MTTIFHFSDFHILPRRGMVRAEGDPCRKVEKVIEMARECGVRPSFSVITGDLSQDGSESGYEIVREYIAQIEALGGPVFPAVGNVDQRGNFRRILLGEEGAVDDGPCYYSRRAGGIHVVVLDSQVPGTDHGAFDDVQLRWLEAQLAESAEPCLVAFHHPVTWKAFDRDHARRFRRIASEANVAAVLHGHLHHSRFTYDGGVCYVQGSAALSDIAFSEREARVYDSCGFNIVTYDDGTLSVRPMIYSEGRRLVKVVPH